MARCRILIVEDSLLIVRLVEEVCAMIDVEIVDAVGTLSEALRVAETGDFDMALLDINLHDELAFPVADLLVALRKPFFFSSGYMARQVMPERFLKCDVLPKPYEVAALIAMLEKSIARIGAVPVGLTSGGK